jgi:hypothetical protein
MNRRKLTKLDLQKMKESENQVVWITAYDQNHLDQILSLLTIH